MSAPAVFEHLGHELRVVVDDAGEPWFVAADVAAVLGHATAKDLTRSLDVDEKGRRLVPTPGGDQVVHVISEPGLYRAIVQRQTGRMVDESRRGQVKAFQRWVTHEVLPAIRRTGSYAAPAPKAPRELTRMDLIEMARDSELRRLEAVERAETAEGRALELEEPAARYQQFMDADGTYGLNDVAKIIGGPGRTGLMQLMREDGILTQDNLPLQRHLIAGRFVVKVSRPWKMPDGTERVSRSTRVTAKGLDWLAEKYGPSSAQLLMINGGGGEW